MRRAGWLRIALLAGLLAGCSRPGPTFTPAKPAALQTLERTATAQPAADRYVVLGRYHVQQRDWLSAVDAYDQALKLDRRNLTALSDLASLHLAHGDAASAEPLVATIEREYPNQAAAQAMLGDFYGQLNKRELALASYRKALTLDPNQPMALLRLGQAALAQERLDEAQGYARRLLATDPDWAQAKAFRLEVAQASDRPDEVGPLLEEAWRTNPTPQARALLSTFLVANRRGQEALALNDSWLRSHPGDVPAIIARAEALVVLGDARAASRSLEKLTEAKTPDPRPYLALARMRLAARRTDEGITLLRDALNHAPVDSGIRMQVAELYGRYDHGREALDVYRQVMQDDPRLVTEVAWRVAMILQEEGAQPNDQGDPVETYYAIALQNDPNHVPSLNNLAFRYAELEKNLPAAKQMIDRAIQLHGTDANLLDTRGWVSFHQKDLAAAAKDLTAAVQRNSDDPLTLYHYAALLNAQGQPAKALTYAQKARSSGQQFLGWQDCEALITKLRSGR